MPLSWPGPARPVPAFQAEPAPFALSRPTASSPSSPARAQQAGMKGHSPPLIPTLVERRPMVTGADLPIRVSARGLGRGICCALRSPSLTHGWEAQRTAQIPHLRTRGHRRCQPESLGCSYPGTWRALARLRILKVTQGQRCVRPHPQEDGFPGWSLRQPGRGRGGADLTSRCQFASGSETGRFPPSRENGLGVSSLPEGVPTSRRRVKNHQRNWPLERRRLGQTHGA